LINLVTGGAGFIGSNLINKLLSSGEIVICIDNFSTGHKRNISEFFGNSNFSLIEGNICNPFNLKTDRIWHLASPASPDYYQENPIETAKTIFNGTQNVLEIAKKNKSPILIASSSEVYGRTKNLPQTENNIGLVNPLCKRSCYSEAKRLSETLSYDYLRKFNIDLRVVRLFNTYGPNMDPLDGRVISNFICKTISKKSMQINGEGLQTRSFCFIDDIIDGLIKVMDSNHKYPLNLGNPYEEHTILALANIIKLKLNTDIPLTFKKSREEEIFRRKPDITKARKILNWNPNTTLSDGLSKTIDYFKKELNK